MKYTTRQAEMLGLAKEIPSTLMGTWDMESSEEKILHILSIVPTEKMQQEVKECGVFLKTREVCIRSDSQTMSVPMFEVPLWAVPRTIGYKFLLVEEVDPADHMEEGDMGEVIVVETAKTYPEAEKKRKHLLSS